MKGWRARRTDKQQVPTKSQNIKSYEEDSRVVVGSLPETPVVVVAAAAIGVVAAAVVVVAGGLGGVGTAWGRASASVEAKSRWLYHHNRP